MSVITSLTAKCKDCHRCIRTCHVKAISLRNGQAKIVPERCVVCGQCVAVCPQRAKSVSDSTVALKEWRRQGIRMVASIAPSFPAAFPNMDPLQVLAGLRDIGFCHVEETALAAAAVARHYHDVGTTNKRGYTISSCCPVVVNLVEIYFPELMGQLAATVSPMVLHGRILRERFPDAKVVFVGPCAGKVDESLKPSAQGSVDAVLTFRQLAAYWKQVNCDPQQLPPVQLRDAPPSAVRLYPLDQGLTASSRLQSGVSRSIISVAGVESCMELFAELAAEHLSPSFVEAFGCHGGCVGGSEMPFGVGVHTRKDAVIRYHERTQSLSDANRSPLLDPNTWDVSPRIFTDRRHVVAVPSEAEIRRVLMTIGQESSVDERNCGGCGYLTCREKAIATLQGFAELEMCIPFMRAKFESLSHLVVESSPNGVIIANSDLTIHQFNDEAQRMFNPEGRPTKDVNLVEFLDPTDFIGVLTTDKSVYKRVEYPDLALVTRQVIYALPAYGLVVGIITDITEDERQHREIEAKNQATIQRATAVISNQMKLAQQIAGLLGESTAATKATLFELISSLTDGNGGTEK
ncbi:MAG: Periplasmic (Fe) hydrogenase large subunit [Firmicutes bacterium]|nr:Periplasmic (Fe) hydrogenase large subunit [candidate division NPL-UPA2 bacterium]